MSSANQGNYPFRREPTPEERVPVLGVGALVTPIEEDRYLCSSIIAPRIPLEFLDFADFSVPHRIESYSETDRSLYQLIARHRFDFMEKFGCSAWKVGAQRLGISSEEIPSISRISDRLSKETGWRVQGVPGELPSNVSAAFLANKVCPIVVGIRQPDRSFDKQQNETLPTYTESNIDFDFTRDILGYVPMLADPRYAEFLQQWAHCVNQILTAESTRYSELFMDELVAIFGHTIDRGVIIEDGTPKVYGGSFVSGDLLFDPSKSRQVRLSLPKVLETPISLRCQTPKQCLTIHSFGELGPLLTCWKHSQTER